MAQIGSTQRRQARVHPRVPDERRTGAEPQRPEPGARLLELQRTAGNAAVTRLVERLHVQRRTEPGPGMSTGGVLPNASGPAPAPAPTAPSSTVTPISNRQPAGVAEHLPTAAELADMPAVADAAGLMAENRALYAARAARRHEFDLATRRGERPDPATKEFTADEQARVDVLNRQLKARQKGDEDETLRAAGITTGVAAWFAEVKDYAFLGATVTAHRLLAERLARAESMLSAETPPAGGWFTSAHSLRQVGESLHSFGMAIDVDGGRNPYLINPDARGATDVEAATTSRAINDIVNRAGLLVRGSTAAEVDLQSRPANTDKDARALDSYDKLRAASDAVARYFELDDDANRPALDVMVRTVGTKDTRTAEEWIDTIKADRRTLRAKAAGKSWSQPETGFLHLDKRFVKAMTSSAGGGLTWLGDDIIGSGRDIMHFDMRGPGPIRAIAKSATGRGPVGLGSG